MKKFFIVFLVVISLGIFWLDANSMSIVDKDFGYSVATSMSTYTPFNLIKDLANENNSIDSFDDYFNQLRFSFNTSFLCNYTSWFATGLELKTNYFLTPFLEGVFFMKVNCTRNLYVKFGGGFYTLVSPGATLHTNFTSLLAEAKLGFEKFGVSTNHFYYFFEIGPTLFLEEDFSYDTSKAKGHLDVTFGTRVLF